MASVPCERDPDELERSRTLIHYHGGPITPETCAIKAWSGRHAFVSWAAQQQLTLAASITQSFALDNGAFSLWKSGKPVNWEDFYRWSEGWLNHPACDWAVIPDVIDGTEDENDALIDQWPHGDRGVPVWHLNESIERLERLAAKWPRIALGSAAEFDVRRTKACMARLREALPRISDVNGRPKVKLHGLRMLNPKLVTQIPLASGDSTTVARNIGLDVHWKNTYAPKTKEGRAVVLVERIEAFQAPERIELCSDS